MLNIFCKIVYHNTYVLHISCSLGGSSHSNSLHSRYCCHPNDHVHRHSNTDIFHHLENFESCLLQLGFSAGYIILTKIKSCFTLLGVESFIPLTKAWVKVQNFQNPELLKFKSENLYAYKSLISSN